VIKKVIMKQKIFISILILILFALLTTCKKDFETPTGGNKIEFNNTIVDSVSYSWVQLTTEFTNTGGNEILQHGYCWSTGQKPTIEDNKIELGSLDNQVNIQTTIDSLTNNTNYYIRLFLAYYGGILYGDEVSIKTLKTGIPLVLTSEVSDVTLYTAVCGGTIEADSGLTVTTRGICWDTINEFNIDDCLNKTINGDSLGVFTSNITELEEGKDYFVKAYATNEKGTGYGDTKTFSTIPLSVPQVTTSNISDITTISAVGGGEVINNGNGTVTVRGICWSTYDNVSLENYDGKTENGTGPGSFISNLTDLTDGTIYYVIAYAINEKGTGYGEVKSFQTIAIGAPTVITSDVTDITTISAQCGGNVTNSGNGTISARGVCWNTTGNPTLDNCDDYTVDGNGLGNYSSYLTGLLANTEYYISAYATNEEGTAYGNIELFNTLIALSIVTTTDVINITSNSAQCGGTVISNGNGTVTSRGICWNTLSNPSLQNCLGYTTDGSGLGNYISYITGLDEGTIYYVAAYATNEEGTNYGDVKSFETIDYSPCDGQSFINYLGQVYEIIEISYQCWMAENLNVGTRINGVDEQTNNSIIEKYCYNDDTDNCDEYGGLYQWNEMMQYTTAQGAQGICPDCWHIPTDDEWKILEGTVDSQYPVGDPEWDGTGWRGFDAGYNLKSENGWNYGGNGSDAFGFSALPGGYRDYYGYFRYEKEGAFFWPSTESGASAWYRDLNFSGGGVGRSNDYRVYGLSVRCVKD